MSMRYSTSLSFKMFLPLYQSIIYTYAIMKTMCPPGYHHNGFVATHVHDVRSCVQLHELPQSYCGDNREGTWFL